MSDRIDRLVSSIAVDGKAARVTGRGVHYDPQMRPHATKALIGMPPILRPVKAGQKMGRWTIIGLAAESPTTSAKKPDSLFVVKCVCGRYGLRRKKSLGLARKRNEGCPECKHFQFVKRQYRKPAPTGEIMSDDA